MFNLRGEVRVLNAKDRERLFLIVLGIEQMHLLNNFSAFAFLFCEETGQNHAGVVEAAGARLTNPNFALFLLILPDTGSVVLRLAYKSAVRRI